jgi:hypothetical protein
MRSRPERMPGTRTSTMTVTVMTTVTVTGTVAMTVTVTSGGNNPSVAAVRRIGISRW